MGRKDRRTLSKKFLEGHDFNPTFDTDKTRTPSTSISAAACFTKQRQRTSGSSAASRQRCSRIGTDGYIIDVERFHAAMTSSLRDYFALLCKPESTDRRKKLWTKMNHICNVRMTRGAMEVLDASRI